MSARRRNRHRRRGLTTIGWRERVSLPDFDPTDIGSADPESFRNRAITDQFEPGSDFAAWAFETARFEIKSHRRKDRRNLTGFSDRLLDSLADEAAASVRDISDTEVALEHCLKSLSEDDRKLLLERYQPRASVANIAESIGSPVQTIYSRLKRVRRGMMECVEREMTRRDRP